MAFPKLFIPRKNYLVGADGKPLPTRASADEIANYDAIERWANSLTTPSSFAPRSDLRIVSASNSHAFAKTGSDYVCTGTNDDATIQLAVNDITGSGPGVGTVLLHPGQYNFGTTGVNFGGAVGVRSSGFPTFDASVTIISFALAATNVLHLAATVEGLAVRSAGFGATTNLLEAIITSTGWVRNCRFDMQGGFSGGTATCVSTAQIVEGCFFATARSTSGFLGVAQTGSGSELISAVRSCGFDGGQGVLVSGAVGSASSTYDNLFRFCALGAITLNSNCNGAEVFSNKVRDGTSTTTDGITVNGTRSYVHDNIVKNDGQPLRNGINVLAAATNCIVTENDLKSSGTVNSLLDSGVGTIKNFDGSANNWNLL